MFAGREVEGAIVLEVTTLVGDLSVFHACMRNPENPPTPSVRDRQPSVAGQMQALSA
jgi:hypothetical protein